MSTPFFPPPLPKAEPPGPQPALQPYRTASQPFAPRTPITPPHLIPTAKKPHAIAVEKPKPLQKYLAVFGTFQVVRLLLAAATIGLLYLLDCSAKAYLTR